MSFWEWLEWDIVTGWKPFMVYNQQCQRTLVLLIDWRT